MASALRQLTNIIAQNVERITDIYENVGVALPTLDEPSKPNATLASNAELIHAITLVHSAASQLLATILPSSLIITEASTAFTLTGALGVIENFHIAEIIREGGSGGIHINEIGKKANQDPAKIGRLLRFLATSYIFKEVAPNVFAHNRNSALIDTGKTWDEIKARPLEKYSHSNGIASTIGSGSEIAAKASVYLTETFKDPMTAFLYTPNHAAFCRGFGTNKTLFEWLEEPQNELQRKRFGTMMGATVTNPESILDAHDWKSLSEGSIIVDVGGGVGNAMKVLVKAHPHLKFIIQDRPEVVEDGLKAWKEHSPNVIDNHQVMFQAQDFFEPQPADLRAPSIYFLRQVTHNWANEWCIKILTQLRANAGSHTKLIVSEIVTNYACRLPTEDKAFAGIPGAVQAPAPEPLLANFGRGGAQGYIMDYVMMLLRNSQERVLGEFIELGEESGWKLRRVCAVENGAHAYLIFEPM